MVDAKAGWVVLRHGFVAAALLILVASCSPWRPATVPQDSWNTGTFIQPGIWVSCKPAEADMLACETFDVSGTVRIDIGTYLRVGKYTRSGVYSSPDTPEVLRNTLQFKREKLTYLSKFTFPIGESHAEFVVRDASCLERELIGSAGHDDGKDSVSVGAPDAALEAIFAAFPTTDLVEKYADAPPAKFASTEEYLKTYRNLFGERKSTVCGVYYSMSQDEMAE